MLAYVADVFGHTLVVPPFFIRLKLGYNGGSFFVKWESILNRFEWRDILEKSVSVYLSESVSIYLSAIVESGYQNKWVSVLRPFLF